MSQRVVIRIIYNDYCLIVWVRLCFITLQKLEPGSRIESLVTTCKLQNPISLKRNNKCLNEMSGLHLFIHCQCQMKRCENSKRETTGCEIVRLDFG